jgi:hypothetical protein
MDESDFGRLGFAARQGNTRGGAFDRRAPLGPARCDSNFVAARLNGTENRPYRHELRNHSHICIEADMVANIILVLTAIPAVLQILDILLSDDKKAVIERFSLRLWDWLDSRKRITLRQRMVLPPLRNVVYFVMWSTNSTLLNYLTDELVVYYSLRVILPLSILIPLSGQFLWPRIAKTTSNVKLAAFSAILLLTYAALLTLGALYLDYCCVKNPTYWLLDHPWRVLAFVTLLVCGQAAIFILVPLFISLIGRPILWATELMVRRITEYPKDLGTLVVSIGILIKLLNT